MCFSAEASFIASFVLSLTGIATLKIASPSIYRWLALTPLFFAVQQFNEGILWLYMSEAQPESLVPHIAQYVFLFFAYFFWPLWIPFSLLMAETNPKKRTIISLSLGAGIGMVSYFILNYIFNYTEPVKALVVGHSIQYTANDPVWKIIYGFIVLIPCFTSSLHWMKFYGVLIAASFLVAEYFYSAVFVSVWCFIAAVLSLTLFGVLKVNRR